MRLTKWKRKEKKLLGGKAEEEEEEGEEEEEEVEEEKVPEKKLVYLDDIIVSSSSSMGFGLKEEVEEFENIELIIKAPYTKQDIFSITRSKLHKRFGDHRSKRTPSLVNVKMIAVDEKEKMIDRTKSINSGCNDLQSAFRLASDKSSISQLTAVRSNVNRYSSKIGKKPPQRPSHFRRSRSNVSVLTKSKQLRPMNNFTNIINNTNNMNITNSENKSLKIPFIFKVSLDSLEGISCVNFRGQKDMDELQKTTVLISYFKLSSVTGLKKKYNAHSLPFAKKMSGIREIYGAKFESNDNLGQNQCVTLPVCMTKDTKSKSGYLPNTFYFEVSLKKGVETIRLGHAILPLNGDEADLKRSIPVGEIKIVTSRTGNKGSSSKASKITTKGMNSVSFLSDPRTKYIITKATLKISSINAEIDRDELDSMVVCPSIRQNVSNLSEDGADGVDCGGTNDIPGTDVVRQIVAKSTSCYSSSMQDLMNLESCSTREIDLNEDDDETYNEDKMDQEDSTIIPHMGSDTLSDHIMNLRSTSLELLDELNASNLDSSAAYSTDDNYDSTLNDTDGQYSTDAEQNNFDTDSDESDDGSTSTYSRGDLSKIDVDDTILNQRSFTH